jgi:hypothetical protein
MIAGATARKVKIYLAPKPGVSCITKTAKDTFRPDDIRSRLKPVRDKSGTYFEDLVTPMSLNVYEILKRRSR